MAEVSVIIVTRNTLALTRAAIRSVLDSEDAFTRLIIVVDNGSTDNSPTEIPREFPAIRYIRSEKNLGFGRANNLGAREAAGEYILLLNSDARLRPESLGQAVAFMSAHPKCGIAGAQLLNPDGSPQNSIANFPTLATELLNKSLLRRLFPHKFPGKERRYLEPVEVESVVGAFMLIRAEVWRALGGFDERYFFFFEETDLTWRAHQQGWKIIHLPHVQVWHEQGGTAREWPAAARIEYWRSRYTYFRKNRGVPTLALLSLGLAVRLVIGWLLSGASVCLSFGKKVKWRERCRVQGALVKWHLQGCPAAAGLPK